MFLFLETREKKKVPECGIEPADTHSVHSVIHMSHSKFLNRPTDMPTYRTAQLQLKRTVIVFLLLGCKC